MMHNVDTKKKSKIGFFFSVVITVWCGDVVSCGGVWLGMPGMPGMLVCLVCSVQCEGSNSGASRVQKVRRYPKKVGRERERGRESHFRSIYKYKKSSTHG